MMTINVRFCKGEEEKEFKVELGENEFVENSNTIPIKLGSLITQEQLNSLVGKAYKMLEGTEWDSPETTFTNYWGKDV